MKKQLFENVGFSLPKKVVRRKKSFCCVFHAPTVYFPYKQIFLFTKQSLSAYADVYRFFKKSCLIIQ